MFSPAAVAIGVAVMFANPVAQTNPAASSPSPAAATSAHSRQVFAQNTSTAAMGFQIMQVSPPAERTALSSSTPQSFPIMRVDPAGQSTGPISSTSQNFPIMQINPPIRDAGPSSSVLQGFPIMRVDPSLPNPSPDLPISGLQIMKQDPPTGGQSVTPQLKGSQD